jgi:hypothetical protein
MRQHRDWVYPLRIPFIPIEPQLSTINLVMGFEYAELCRRRQYLSDPSSHRR